MINSASSAFVSTAVAESAIELASSSGVITSQPTADGQGTQAPAGGTVQNQFKAETCIGAMYCCCKVLAYASAGCCMVGHVAVPICICTHAPAVVINTGMSITFGGGLCACCWWAHCDGPQSDFILRQPNSPN